MMNKFFFRFKIIERYWILVINVILTFFFVILGVRFFVVAPGRVDGPSMESTFIDEQLFFVNKSIYFFKKPERYEVVQVIDPEDQKLVIKRLIGLPGDVVEIKRGKIFLQESGMNNFKVLDESDYLDEFMLTKIISPILPNKFELGEDEYFVVGDNRPKSIDSRFYGPIKRDKILGKVFGF